MYTYTNDKHLIIYIILCTEYLNLIECRSAKNFKSKFSLNILCMRYLSLNSCSTIFNRHKIFSGIKIHNYVYT